MSESEEEVDIFGSIGPYERTVEFQDEILSSDESGSSDDSSDESGDEGSSGLSTKQEFPSLELSDGDEEVMEYFSAPKAKKASNGSFPGLGLSQTVVRNINRKGFKTPTPIQRKTIPLILDGRDVVGMARTGSGKTAAFVLPMIEKLKVHSAKIGARALILSPSRELALQTIKVIKDFIRGSDLRVALLVGGDSIEEQFGFMMNNPDIIVATPGRFLHLKVEMKLDMKTVQYVVFDEADRLFEQGLSEQLVEIVESLASGRQTLLFSATLPKSLVEFARAGLQDPLLIRLDADSKLSENLQMSYFSIKDSERDAALCYILRHVIKMPTASPEQKRIIEAQDEAEDSDDGDERATKKRKFKREKLPPATELPTPESTIVFAPTKHHVEYLANLLKDIGYSVSYVYGTLDQTARKQQLLRFRCGHTSIMVVTDVAARGIDIPVLANVINYTIPASPKIFIHRVGRTARAGHRGWAYTLVRDIDLPYLLDLEIFLGRKLLYGADTHRDDSSIDYSNRLVLGSLPNDDLEAQMNEVDSIIHSNYDIQLLLEVAMRGEKMYNRTKNVASRESIARAKEVVGFGWNHRNPLFGKSQDDARQELLDKLANRRVKETVFEFKKTSFGSAAELMSKRRQQIAPIQQKAQSQRALKEKEREAGLLHTREAEIFNDKQEQASEGDISSVFKDPNYYMPHYSKDFSANDSGYQLNGGFADAARGAQFDLTGEGDRRIQKQGVIKWDKKRGKFIKTKGEPQKFVKGESGERVALSFRSGKFDQWKASHKSSGYKVGSAEISTPNGSVDKVQGVKRFKHNKVEAPKPADASRDDYYSRKKRVKEAIEKGLPVKGLKGKVINNGLKSVDQVRKDRLVQEKRKQKNARPKRGKK